MDQGTTTSTPPPKPNQAKRAIAYVLNAISNDPAKYWLMGEGTESYAQLTAAHADLHGASVDDIRRTFRPDAKRWERFMQEREREQKLLRYCADHGITGEEQA